jgi:hypothetical protein
MKKLWQFPWGLVWLALLLAAPTPAHSQAMSYATVVTTCGTLPLAYTASSVSSLKEGAITVDVNGNECVNASVSASITGFAPGGVYATLTATASSADVALPAGTSVLVTNTGTAAVSCVLAVGSGTATASKIVIQPGGTTQLTVGSNTHIACIDQTGSASNLVVIAGGAGLAAGWGGSGSAAAGNFALETGGNLATIATNTAAAIPGCGATPCANTTQSIGYVSDDPCLRYKKTPLAISMTGTTTLKLVSGVASNNLYVCFLNLRASAATVWSIADGTKVSTECDTAAHAVIGATTATHGLSEAANGGNAYGGGTIGATVTVAHDLCLFQSGSGDLSGEISYVIAP